VRYQAAPHPDTTDSNAAVDSQQAAAVDHSEGGLLTEATIGVTLLEESRHGKRSDGAGHVAPESAYIALALG